MGGILERFLATGAFLAIGVRVCSLSLQDVNRAFFLSFSPGRLGRPLGLPILCHRTAFPVLWAHQVIWTYLAPKLVPLCRRCKPCKLGLFIDCRCEYGCGGVCRSSWQFCHFKCMSAAFMISRALFTPFTVSL